MSLYIVINMSRLNHSTEECNFLCINNKQWSQESTPLRNNQKLISKRLSVRLFTLVHVSAGCNKYWCCFIVFFSSCILPIWKVFTDVIVALSNYSCFLSQYPQLVKNKEKEGNMVFSQTAGLKYGTGAQHTKYDLKKKRALNNLRTIDWVDNVNWPP